MDKHIDEILKLPIDRVKSVGQARAKLLQKLGIYTVEDAVTHFPREYEDRSLIKCIAELQDGETCSLAGVISSQVSSLRLRKGLCIYKVQVRDETGCITAVWYNQDYVKTVLKPGNRYVFYGKISKKHSSFEIQNPIFNRIDGNSYGDACRIMPVYPSTSRLSQNVIRSIIQNALDLIGDHFEETIPQWIRSKYNLCEINYAYRNIHFPSSLEDFENARLRLVFEELLILQLGLLSIKNAYRAGEKGIAFKTCPEIQKFIDNLPFRLTNAQKKVFEEIKRDMESEKAMNRLVQGDVGSGKTIVAVLALFKAVKNGFQGALMVPTEILAEQHFETIKPLLQNYNINTGLLTGSQTKKQKEDILKALGDGSMDVVIGTHALLEEKVLFRNLGLVITDEQHRFGVRQRAMLLRKGKNPDMLVMTATPIPRTLALILYGDLDISVIDELPPGRKPVKTYVVDNAMRQRVSSFIRKQVAEGRQVYIVCPLVEESDTIEAKSAMELAEKIARQDFPDLRVGLVHGKMKAFEKDETMRKFASGEIDILVSTTVIEVGVNVPNATVMVVENAERFGLAQLHQLRGRVGRGEHQSYCILYNQSKTHVSRERMKVLQKTNDGFVIAEKDLELRGPGEFFGTMQHGLPDLKIANLYRDMNILKNVQEVCRRLMEDDHMLEKEENKMLKDRIMSRLFKKLDNLSFN